MLRLSIIANRRSRRARRRRTRCRTRSRSPGSPTASASAALDVDELMALTVLHNHEARLRSYRLLAEAFAGAGADRPPTNRAD